MKVELIEIISFSLSFDLHLGCKRAFYSSRCCCIIGYNSSNNNIITIIHQPLSPSVGARSSMFDSRDSKCQLKQISRSFLSSWVGLTMSIRIPHEDNHAHLIGEFKYTEKDAVIFSRSVLAFSFVLFKQNRHASLYFNDSLKLWMRYKNIIALVLVRSHYNCIMYSWRFIMLVDEENIIVEVVIWARIKQ